MTSKKNKLTSIREIEKELKFLKFLPKGLPLYENTFEHGFNEGVDRTTEIFNRYIKLMLGGLRMSKIEIPMQTANKQWGVGYNQVVQKLNARIDNLIKGEDEKD